MRGLVGRLRGFVGGFAFFHAGNMAMTMAIGVLMLIVLSRLLPGGRYAEVVFMTSVGLYFIPFDTALGKAGFAALKEAEAASGRAVASPAQYGAALLQLGLGVAVAAAIASSIAAPLSRAWFEDALFMALCRLYGVWSCHMQPVAWALGCNLGFVKLTSAIRLSQIGALLVATAVHSFLVFGAVSVGATLVCMAVALALFRHCGAFDRPEAVQPTSVWLSAALAAAVATGCDVLAYNAPYLLVSTRFGVGPLLVVFDSVMKVSRIAMTGSRTLSEISLPRQSALQRSGDGPGGARLFLGVVAACTAASALPAALIALDGRAVFRFLLGANDVVPADAMLPAAALALALGFYQSASFFIGYSNDRGAIARLTGASAVGFAVCTASLVASDPSTARVLATFAAYLGAVGAYAVALSLRLVGAAAERARRDPAPVAEAALPAGVAA